MTSSGSSASGTSNASSASSTERSDVWKHFDKTGTKNVTCRLWGKQLAYHRGTMNLRDHLTRVHMDKYKPAKRTDDQPSLETFVRKCSDARAKLINIDVVTMDIRPLAIVDGEGMRRLLLYLEPGYCLPSRKHISSLLRKKNEKAIAILKGKLTQDAITVSLTKQHVDQQYDGGFTCPSRLILSHLLGKCRAVY